MKPENINPGLKKKLTNAKSIEEIRDIAAEAGCALSDEQLDGVAGGEGPWVCVRDWSCAQKTMEPGPPTL